MILPNEDKTLAQPQPGPAKEGAELEPELDTQEDEEDAAVEGNDSGAAPPPAAEDGKPEQKEQSGTTPPSGFVPHAALHEARQETRELRDKLTRMESAWEHFTRQQQQAQAQAGQQAAEAQLPSFEDDPVGHMNARLNMALREVAALKNNTMQQYQAEQQRAKSSEMLNRYAASCRTYAAKEPDFNDAYQFLAKSVDEELQARGFTDPVERSNVLQYEEGRLAGRAMQLGQDPAETLYKLALHRGYKKEAASGGDRLSRLAAGAKAAKSLSGGKPAGNGEMSLERLSELYDTDPVAADKMFAKMAARGMLG